MPLRPAVAAAAVVAFLLVPAAQAGSRDALQQQLARALHARHVSPARTGAIVLDLQTGRTLFTHNPRLPLLPASNQKLATTYAGLTALGPSFRIETDVLGEGRQSGETWQGNLVLKGYGDPSLSAAEVRSLARQVAADGIRHVTGRILGDESWFDTRRTGLGWKAQFYLHESPALSALVVDRGWTGRYETSRPALTAARLFRLDLRRAGVTIDGGAAVGDASVGAVPLADIESPPLAVLVRHMDVYSDNFYAEMLLKEVGAVQGTGGSASAGLVVERRLLTAAGVPLTGVRMVDGSGLSLLDRWTARGLATLLRTMWLDSDLKPYVVPALPIAGETGTLDYRMRTGPAHGFVRAKTGTTDNSSALSGFVGDRYVFSVVENGSPVRTRNAERSQNRFAEALARAALALAPAHIASRSPAASARLDGHWKLGRGFDAVVDEEHRLSGSTWGSRTFEVRRDGRVFGRWHEQDVAMQVTPRDITGDGIKDVLVLGYIDGSGGCGSYRLYGGSAMGEVWQLRNECEDTARVRLRRHGVDDWTAILSSKTRASDGSIHCCWRRWRHREWRWRNGALRLVQREITTRPPQAPPPPRLTP